MMRIGFCRQSAAQDDELCIGQQASNFEHQQKSAHVGHATVGLQRDRLCKAGAARALQGPILQALVHGLELQASSG
jgi:hypothetical protein